MRNLRLLSPFDLQCIKASGVTFAVSAIERVIEERARGDAARADSLRASLRERIGTDIRSVKPGSDAAQRLKEVLISDGLWSQYLEVAIGPDAEIFTKGPPLSSVGWGDWIGVRSDSAWNNPEPEMVLACNARVGFSAPRLATTSICGTSKVEVRCCSARRRTTTHRAPSGLSSACSTASSHSTTYVPR